MPSIADWKVPASAQPRPADYEFDLERALSAVVGLHSIVPADAFSASSLGVERAGNGVLIGDGLILTIGYLITEAETIWLHLGNGRIVPGHALAFDSETGFGLVQALDRIDLVPLPLGSSSDAQVDDRIIVAGVGGRTRSVAGRIVGKQEFAGYWEYALDEAIFTLPSHPNWRGTGLISASGELLGIGSLQIERSVEGKHENLNMIVPIDLLKPILSDMRRFGRIDRPVRPWLGVFSTGVDDKVVIVGLSERGPAAQSDIRTGDMVVAVGGARVKSQIDFYRKVWALGPAGVDVPLRMFRDGVTFDAVLTSIDRSKLLKKPRLH